MFKGILITLYFLFLSCYANASYGSGSDYRKFEAEYMSKWYKGYCLLNTCGDALAKKHARMVELKLKLEAERAYDQGMRGDARFYYVQNKLELFRENTPRFDGRIFPRVTKMNHHAKPKPESEFKSSSSKGFPLYTVLNFFQWVFIIMICFYIFSMIIKFASPSLSESSSSKPKPESNPKPVASVKPESKDKPRVRVDESLFEKMKVKQEGVFLNTLSPFQKAFEANRRKSKEVKKAND
jgi:hypothetical protein